MSTGMASRAARWRLSFTTILLLILGVLSEDIIKDNKLLSTKEEKMAQWRPWRSHESDLRDHLMSGYDRSARPSVSTNVTFYPTIKHFDMNEKLQSLDLDVWTTMNWVDPRLMWDQDKYYGIQTLVFHKGDIWEPDLSIYNNAEITEFSLMSSNRLEVRYDGFVLSIPPAHLKAACVMDLTYWPYDLHNCTVKYGSWVYDGTAVNLNTLSSRPRIDMDVLASGNKNLTRGEWRLLQAGLVRNINKYDCCPHPYIDVDLSLLLKREAPAYEWTVKLPIIVLIFMTSLIFILPPGGSEKLIFGGICLLINLMILEYCSRVIQHAPSHAPLFVQLIGQQLKLTTGSVLMCAIVLRLVRGPYIVSFPNCLRSVLIRLSVLLCLGRYKPTVIRTSSGNGSVLSRSTTITVEEVEMGDNGSASLYPQDPKQDRVFASSPSDWIMLGCLIDRICLFVYIVMVIIFFTEYRNIL